MSTQYRATRGFEYPGSKAKRDEIRRRTKSGKRLPLSERGEIVQVAAGERIEAAPDDLIDGWLDRGLVVVDGEE